MTKNEIKSIGIVEDSTRPGTYLVEVFFVTLAIAYREYFYDSSMPGGWLGKDLMIHVDEEFVNNPDTLMPENVCFNSFAEAAATIANFMNLVATTK